ncbi:hypothetical protein M0R45_031152 [Rubus argutus]|uniref:Uncharacterized protein n=1 Tax=Rubus argutus TaxID=59490 RepID=A0AAW1WCR7_RUBAR
MQRLKVSHHMLSPTPQWSFLPSCLKTKWRQHKLPLGACEPPSSPARPLKPQLVHPKKLPAPKNSVADDESRHFSWCSQRLAELGFNYGDMPAHNLLWRECEKSSENVAARLAVIPLVQEARGLDAGPRLVQKLLLASTGLSMSVKKLDCAPSSAFKDLLEEYNVELKGPFNYSARDEAGIPRDWYDLSTNNKDKSKKRDNSEKLSKVYERLASIISMESENSSLSRP